LNTDFRGEIEKIRSSGGTALHDAVCEAIQAGEQERAIDKAASDECLKGIAARTYGRAFVADPDNIEEVYLAISAEQ